MGQLDIFGSDTYEYLFIIEPDQKTAEKLIELRMFVNSMIPLSEEILHSKPHISICYFKASEFSNDLIITKTKQVLSSVKSFDIQLEGSEKWKNGNLVLKVNPDTNTLELQKKLSGAFRGVIKKFHLTIVRNIADKLLDQLPMENFDYKSVFKCEAIYILKKKENKPYQLLDTIYL
ncbi:MAG: hypothetical protein K0S23_3440 [Fluviicola sp.]|jgi:2'-5' RNA ligase|uniref:2'-5' RNA ligase family protein n=1 Tax=Fluviicola sp. TaxID=1917219 RepID=UPI002635EE8C|nr:2'-5' RNA ligase family protein [Fluviicola sp.]MDF3029133.1 hypothetical protein [Fluviicola sp.]